MLNMWKTLQTKTLKIYFKLWTVDRKKNRGRMVLTVQEKLAQLLSTINLYWWSNAVKRMAFDRKWSSYWAVDRKVNRLTEWAQAWESQTFLLIHRHHIWSTYQCILLFPKASFYIDSSKRYNYEFQTSRTERTSHWIKNLQKLQK